MDITPSRGAGDIRSSQPVTVHFDRPMNEASVASHFHVVPSVRGTIRWSGPAELSFEHVPFQAATRYRVVIDGGYRDARGSVNALRHSWTFVTEGPPTLTGASPGQGDQNVDPASYITLGFSRQMDVASLRTAVSMTPGAPFAIRTDAADPFHVVIAPKSLLEPKQTYSVTIGQRARDVDGNPLASGSVISFTTGGLRPLQHWIGFVTQSRSGGVGNGVWIVNENRYPRPLVSAPVTAFTWSPDGSRLLLKSPAGTWTDHPLAGTATNLPFHADWADYLTAGHAFAFLDHGDLSVLQPDGAVLPVASGATVAAVAPGGTRLAFVVAAPGDHGSEIDGYDTALHTRFRLRTEPQAIDSLAWSPDGQSLAYHVDTGDEARQQVKVTSLRDGSVVPIVTGDVSAPVWQADSNHVFVTALVDTPDGMVMPKAFRFAVDDVSPKTLSMASGMPSGQTVGVQSLSTSADGRQVTFISDAGGEASVWLMNADGTGLTQLTQYDPVRFPYSCQGAAWTPA